MADEASYHYSERGHAWTASRCLRLIRPIQSRIALLQKLRDDVRHKLESERRRMLTETNAQASDSRLDCRKRSQDDGTIHGQSRQRTKRAKQTYSRKDGSRGQRQPQRLQQQQQHLHEQQRQEQQHQQRWDNEEEGGEKDGVTEGQPPKTPITTSKSRKLGDCPRLFIKSPVAGRVELETPWLRRVLPPPQCHPSDVPDTNSKLAVPPLKRLGPVSNHSSPPDIRALRDKISSSQYRVYEAIGAWLHGLLRQTQGTPGVKTLLAMTLRRLSVHLRGLDASEKQESSRQGLGTMDQTPPSIRIYHELELFAGSKRRDRLLCVFVRAHGIEIINQAIIDGLLRSEFADLLARFCIDAGAVEEGMGLLQTIIQTQKLAGPSGARSALGQEGGQRALGSLVTSMAAATSPTCAAFESRWLQNQPTAIPCSKLSALLNGGHLVAEWLCTGDFTTGVWRTVILGMASSQSTARFARDFGMTALTLLTSRLQWLVSAKDEMHRAMSRTVTSILAMLYSMAQARGSPLGADNAIAGGLVKILTDDSLTVAVPARRLSMGRYMIAIVLFLLSHQKQRQRQHACISVLPSWRDLEQFAASEITSCIQKEQVGTTNKAISTCRTTVNRPKSAGGGPEGPYWAAVGLVSSMAHVCKRLSPKATHIYVSEMSQPLADLGLESDTKPFRRLRVDCAFFVANLTNDTRDLAFAESLVNGIGPSERGTASESQWRWEEGMNEWVVISPTAPKHQRARARGRPRGDLAA